MKPTLLIWIFQIYSNWTFFVFLKFVYPHLRIFFHCFLGERNGEGWGRETEIDWYERISWRGCLSSRPRPGRITHAENWDPTHNPCMCLDREGRDDTLTNWATQPGPFWVFFKRFYLFIFSKREREGEWEGETHQISERNMDLLPPVHSPTADQTDNLSTRPDQASNLQPFWFTGWCSIQLSHLARAMPVFFLLLSCYR